MVGFYNNLGWVLRHTAQLLAVVSSVLQVWGDLNRNLALEEKARRDGTV